MTFALVFGGAVALRAVGGDGPGRGAGPPDVAPALPVASVAGWSGPASLAFDGLVLRLTPLHADPARQAFDAAALAARLGLDPAGEPWRLELELGQAPAGRGPEADALLAALAEALAAGGPRVEDATGACAAPLLAAAAPAAGEPLAALFDPARCLGDLDAPGDVGQVHLWGRAPGDAPRLVVGDLELTLVSDAFEPDRLATWVARRDGGDA